MYFISTIKSIDLLRIIPVISIAAEKSPELPGTTKNAGEIPSVTYAAGTAAG
jgi:hypothetical protein